MCRPRQNALRLLLVGTSGLVVVMIPNFANLMAIIGGTCCTLLAFILPGLFHMRLRRRWVPAGPTGHRLRTVRALRTARSAR